jgi:DNA-binding GntR family transcriptional regulator
MPLNEGQIPNLAIAPAASEVILRHIRAAIADGSLAEGEPIRQDDVARLFNVSKIPVREALKRLESEGFVTFHRNRGAVVTALTDPELVQIFEMRAILEANALRMSVPHMLSQTFAAAEAFCRAFEAEGDVGEWAALNWKFHSCLYEDAGRPLLMSTIRSLNVRLERYLRVQLTLSNGQPVAAREHWQILDACRQGDADKASDLVHAHIMKACSSLEHHLPRR